jgi:hypothetical protein
MERAYGLEIPQTPRHLSLDSLAFSGDALLTETATFTALLRRHGTTAARS